MGFQIEYVVYVYIGVCIGMIGCSLFLLAFWNVSGGIQDRITKQFLGVVEKQLNRLETGEAIDASLQDRLTKKLRRNRQMTAFYSVLLKELEARPEQMGKYLVLCRPALVKNVYYYRRKSSIYQAFFAYVISLCGIRIPSRRALRRREMMAEGTGILAEFMLRLVLSDSAYCRENALKAIYSFGNEEYVMQALRLMNENDIFHHEKLVTDGLLTFSGDKRRLAGELWKHFGSFREDIRVSIVQFIRNVSDEYTEAFLLCLKDEKHPGKEVRIAMLRYLGRYAYEPARDYLYQMLESEEWETAMTAASSLRSYECPETVLRLKKALDNPNWYVRQNAAESLQAFCTDYQMLASVYSSRDRYAREMLVYQQQQKELKDLGVRETAGTDDAPGGTGAAGQEGGTRYGNN